MRAKSASTTLIDPYRAGLSLGRSLSEIEPEVVFLFVTLQYQAWDEFMDGLYDGLGDPAVRLVGTSGDGFYESSRVSDIGASALALNSGGRVRWHVESGTQVGAHPEGAVRQALASLRNRLEGRDPAFFYMVSDFYTDASRIEAVIHDEIDQPVVGGIAADDDSVANSGCVFIDRTVLRDSVVMLAADGPLAFQIHIANSIDPVGSPGVVDEAQGKTLHRIDSIEALAFLEREIGKPVLRSDQGILLTVLGADEPGEKRLRAVAQNVTGGDGSLTLHGGIRTGERVQVCVADPTKFQDSVRELFAHALATGFDPAAALIVSCAGRKWLLGGQIDHEVQAIASAFGRDIPAAGFSSFGEIAPMLHEGRYTRNLFHNVTYVVMLIGA